MEPIPLLYTPGGPTITTEVSIRQGDMVVFASSREEAIEKWNEKALDHNNRWKKFRAEFEGIING